MMGSLYIGATGLKTLGNGMNVVSNNLSNVNTVGFKKTMSIYQDLASKSENTGSNGVTERSQLGMGVQTGDIHRLFTQGSFGEGTAETDIGIEGIGFFGVQKDGQTQYTRAGNFRFNSEGTLQLGYSDWTLMGYKIDDNGVKSSTETPVSLDLIDNKTFPSLDAKATTKLTAILQLGNVTSKSTDTENPFFSMTSKFDATKQPPLSTDSYSNKQAVSFYDAEGNVVNATMYFNLVGEKNGSKVTEYALALDSDEVSTDKSDGLLMAGTLTFDSSGTITNMTAFTPPAGDPANLGGWTAAELQDGAPVFSVKAANGSTQNIAFSLGLTLTTSTAGLGSATEFATNQSAIYEKSPGATLQNSYSYSRGSSNALISQSKDGWTKGDLSNVEVTDDGYVRGHYSNGQSKDLYQIPLYRFTNQDGLRSEGGNRFSSTEASGAATAGEPKTENFGKLSANTLELSNVDQAEEFVSMITTQRGFQMNSKVISTTDTMLQKAMEIKR